MPGYAPRLDLDRFVPPSVEAAVDLYDAMVRAGVTPTQARSIVGWLQVVHPRMESPISKSDMVTRSLYRTELAKVGIPPWELSKATVAKGA